MGLNILEIGRREIWTVMWVKKGFFVSSSGYRYQGNWKSNMKNGEGIIWYDGGKKYVGQFVDNKREGFGVWDN